MAGISHRSHFDRIGYRGNKDMNAPFIDLRECRIEQARAFAWQFNKFEWKDLCSYQSFLGLIDRGLDTGDFFSAQIRAEEKIDSANRPQQAISVFPTTAQGTSTITRPQ
jgi:hypothetical protein